MNSSKQPGGASTPAHAPDPDGLIALALELIDDNPFMGEFEALNRAAEMLEELDDYAAAWDADAAAAGNPAAAPLFVCLVETAVCHAA